jgi:hypothetical protein
MPLATEKEEEYVRMEEELVVEGLGRKKKPGSKFDSGTLDMGERPLALREASMTSCGLPSRAPGRPSRNEH